MTAVGSRFDVHGSQHTLDRDLQTRPPELARDAWRGEGVAKGDGIRDGGGGVKATWCDAGARGRSGLQLNSASVSRFGLPLQLGSDREDHMSRLFS